jgi:hypothetical protein
MMLGVFWPDVLRGGAIIFGVMALALFPGTVVHRIPGWRAWLVAAVVVMLFASLIGAVWAHLGTAHILWYRSPVLLLSSLLALGYVISVRGWHLWTDHDHDGRRHKARVGNGAARRKDDWRP